MENNQESRTLPFKMNSSPQRKKAGGGQVKNQHLNRMIMKAFQEDNKNVISSIGGVNSGINSSMSSLAGKIPNQNGSLE